MEGSAETALVEIPRETALQVYTTPDAIEPYLRRVRVEIDAFVPDIATKKGRDQIASIAYKVAKCKTYLDGVGKELNDVQKEIPKKIDATRKHIRDTLDAWKDEVRKPLTEWEQAEEARLAAINAALAELQGVIDDREERPAAALRDRLSEVQAQSLTQEQFGDQAAAAEKLKALAIEALQSAIEKADKREAEAAELARLRVEAEERARKDREEQIAKQAEERARAEAERQMQAERDAAAKRELELKLAAERSERERAESQQRAERAEVYARLKAENDLRMAREREAAALAAREADKEHRATVNRAAVAALVEGGIPQDIARTVITLIAKQAIPGLQINY